MRAVALWLWGAWASLLITWIPGKGRGRFAEQVVFVEQSGVFIPASLVVFHVLAGLALWVHTAGALPAQLIA